MDSSRCGTGRGEDTEWSQGLTGRGQVRQTPGGSCTARLGDSLALLSSKGDWSSGTVGKVRSGCELSSGGEGHQGPSDG